MSLNLSDVETRLSQRFPVLVLNFRGELTLTIKREDLLHVLRFLRDESELGFSYLSDVTGTDTRPLNRAFTLSYHLLSQKNRLRVRLNVLLDFADLSIDSATAIWPGAAFQEREIWDLLGVRFNGLKDHTRLYLPDDFDGHPLRKDYSPFAQSTEINGFRG